MKIIISLVLVLVIFLPLKGEEKLSKIGVDIITPSENVIYPCGLLTPTVTLSQAESMIEMIRSRQWLMCYEFIIMEGKGTGTLVCGPIANRLYKGLQVTSTARWRFEMWFEYFSRRDFIKTTNRTRIEFVTECNNQQTQKKRKPTITEEEHIMERITSPLACEIQGTGNLVRFWQDNGDMSFPTFNGEAYPRETYIFFRVAPRTMSRLRKKNSLFDFDLKNGFETRQKYDRQHLAPQFVSILALRRALSLLSSEQAKMTTVFILPNGFGPSNQHNIRTGQWIQQVLSSESLSLKHVNFIVDPYSPSGNFESFEYQSKLIANLDNKNALVFCLEDDVMLQPSALTEIIEFFISHEPCLVTPIDTPLLYTSDPYFLGIGSFSPSRIVAARFRHFRTTQSSTTTFVSTVRVYTFLCENNLIPDPNHDFTHSSQLARLAPAAILSPLPGLASPVEYLDSFTETHVAFYFNYFAYAYLLIDEFLFLRSTAPHVLLKRQSEEPQFLIHDVPINIYGEDHSNSK